MEAPAVKLSKKKDHTLVSINGPMTISQAGELKRGLLQAFELGKRVELSLAGVTEVDLTGLQLICSCHRTALAKQVALSITGAQVETIISVAKLAGMLRHTGCVQDVAGSCVWIKEV